MSKIRILHIIKSLGRGGAETLLPETLKVHDRSKFDFHYLYFLPWKDQMVSSIEAAGGNVLCMPAANNIALILHARKVASYLRDHRIQLVHAHLPWAGVVARLAGKLTGIPIIYTEHNKQERYHLATRTINLLTMNWLTGLIAVSGDVEESIRRNKPFLNTPIRTILNGVNTRHFTPDNNLRSTMRRDLKIATDTPVIGTVAVFRFQKRLDLWLQVAEKIRKKVPNTQFIIVGDGPLRKELQQTASNLNLDGVVHFAGLQTDVRPWFASFDAFMMSSVFEGLPIALLEAMSMGLPVITTDAGGIKEVITHGKEGLVCPTDRSEQLVEFGAEILTNKSKRDFFGVQARKTIEESFSMEKMVTELESYYVAVALESARHVE